MTRGLVNARVTFRGSPMHVLERFAFRDVGAALPELRRRAGLDECVLVQTCNRVELFGSAGGPDAGRIRGAWASLAGVDGAAAGAAVEVGEGGDVLEHLLRLTAGLDSMVVGEEQILGQVKGAIAAARRAGCAGRRLGTLFDRAVRAGARIRGATGIGRGGVSVGSMAVRLAEESMDDMKSRRVLLIGTGEVSTLVAKSLARRGYAFDVAGRTPERSRLFCSAMGGRPVRFEDAMAGFAGYDVLFVASTAPYHLVTRDRIRPAAGGRGMMILDLSNPRTVDEGVANLAGVRLMNLDQIAEMVGKNMRGRMGSVRAVEGMIRDELPAMRAAMNRLDAEPVVGGVFRSTDALRERELRKALRMLGGADEETARVMDGLTRAVAESILSAPMNNLRRASERGDTGTVEAASRLFDYGDG